jgi:excisionase family DNA binding protein
MLEILGEMADGNDVAIVPTDANLTTQQAADMLNVSRPHLVKLLESGKLPFHKAGRHRRVRCADLLAYKAQRDRASAGAMEALARQAQALRIGYE